jgi:hypothetical protein
VLRAGLAFADQNRADDVLSCFRTIREWFSSIGVCIGGCIGSHQRRLDTISPPPPHSILYEAFEVGHYLTAWRLKAPTIIIWGLDDLTAP